MRRVSSEEQTPLAGEECNMAPRTAGQGLLAWPGGNSSGLAEMVVMVVMAMLQSSWP